MELSRFVHGNVTASAAEAAAIGGGYMSSAGIITINGGTVNARATGSSAAIGMGQNPSYNSVTSAVTIKGGIVTATSANGSGIGLGQYPNKKTITVSIGNEDPAYFVSVTANKVSGTVTLTSELTDKTTVYPAGAVSDPSVLNAKTITSCVSTESVYNDNEIGKQLTIHTYHVPADAVLLIGWYDEDGVMLSSDIMTKNNTTVTVFGSELADYATVFVWEDLDSIRPLCECEIIPFENE